MVDIHDEKPVIWLIDENKRELRSNQISLKRILPETLEIRAVLAYEKLDEYLPVLENKKTVCIITDQRLKVTGVATYEGIELAEFLRSINLKIPIYILTNFADDRDDFEDGEWTVEDIIRKSVLNNEAERKVLAARIMRRINLYEDIRSQREEKMQTLLEKSMNGNLDANELNELDQLGLIKNSASLAKELSQIQQMTEIAEAHEELMRRFEHLSH